MRKSINTRLATGIALSLAVCGCALYGQSVPTKDVDGWMAAKWGMSQQELLKAFPLLKTDPQPGLDEVTVEKVRFSVRFLMDPASKRLSEVRLSNLNQDVSPSRFQELETALVEKYGIPEFRQNGIRLIAIWSLPSSNIEIHYGESPLIGHYLILNFSRKAQEGVGRSKQE